MRTKEECRAVSAQHQCGIKEAPALVTVSGASIVRGLLERDVVGIDFNILGCDGSRDGAEIGLGLQRTAAPVAAFNLALMSAQRTHCPSTLSDTAGEPDGSFQDVFAIWAYSQPGRLAAMVKKFSQ